MRITIETTLPTEEYVDPTGNEVCALLELVLENVRYNMAGEPARATTGVVYGTKRDGSKRGTTLATWRLEL